MAGEIALWNAVVMQFAAIEIKNIAITLLHNKQQQTENINCSETNPFGILLNIFLINGCEKSIYSPTTEPDEIENCPSTQNRLLNARRRVRLFNLKFMN